MVKMRIISQDGFIDLPYENIGVSINHSDNTEIIAYPTCRNIIDKGFWVMAKYSNVVKAQKAMEMLHIAYYKNQSEKSYNHYDNYICQSYHAANGEHDEKKRDRMFHSFNDLINLTFQFPSDEDVEV